MTILSQRNFALVGEISENVYDAGRYSVGGREIDEYLHAIQQDVLANVTDQEKDLEIIYEFEIAIEDAMPASGAGQYIAIPAAPQTRRKGTQEVRSYSGRLYEDSGTFYLKSTEKKTPLNLSSQLKKELVSFIDPYVQSRIAAELRVRLSVAEVVVSGDN